MYERWSTEMALIDADVLIDTNDLDMARSLARIEAAITSARSPRTLSH